MALQATRDALRAILKTDPTMSLEDRLRVLGALNARPGQRIVRCPLLSAAEGGKDGGMLDGVGPEVGVG